MAIGRRVLWNGQVFTIVGEAIETNYNNEELSMVKVFVAVNKEEGAGNKSIEKAIWIPFETVFPLVSSFDFTTAEWFLGVFNGQK